MNSKQRHDEYMAKTREAEAQAAKAKDADTRASWESIAENYRELARRQKLD